MKNSEGLINRHQNYHDGKNGETHNTPHPRTVHRPEYQTYPLRKSVEANGNVYGPGSSQKNKPSKFMTNAEARPSWSIMDELNFVTRTPIYKPALSDESAIRLDDESHPFSMPLMLGEAASPAAENNGGGMLVDKIDFPRKKLSNSEAVYTIVNIFVGLGMLSKPYSLAMGGWVSLGGLTLLCFWGAASGLIMIRCFQLVPGSRVTYPQLGEAAMGMAGRRLVQAIILLEFMGATIIVMIFMWKNFSFLFPSIPSHLVAICLTIAAAPSVWLLNFGELSFISLLGVVSNAAIMLALVGLLISEPEQIQPEKYDTYTSMEGLSISMGIYTVALAGHAALPSVYADIEDKSSIFWVVSLSFVIMWFIYCATAAAGYLFHGRGAHVLVTEDIMITNPGRVFEIVTLMVLAKSYCSVSPIVSILNEIPEAGLGITTPWVRRTSRTVCLLVLSVCAYACQEHLGLVEALTGSAFTMMSSFILPPLFLVLLSYKTPDQTPHIGLGKAHLEATSLVRKFTKWDRAYYWFLAVMGFIVGAVFTYGDFRELFSEVSPAAVGSPR
mmetsp:Transcript_23472/g.37836  ORF Transcript_23472/g.37836 Transcript_23472/m.37836 type:complete len:555 (+) Transcript_23472:133-1797(+)